MKLNKKHFQVLTFITFITLKPFFLFAQSCPDAGTIFDDSDSFAYLKMQGTCGNVFKSYSISISGRHFMESGGPASFTFNKSVEIAGDITLEGDVKTEQDYSNKVNGESFTATEQITSEGYFLQKGGNNLGFTMYNTSGKVDNRKFRMQVYSDGALYFQSLKDDDTFVHNNMVLTKNGQLGLGLGPDLPTSTIDIKGDISLNTNTHNVKIHIGETSDGSGRIGTMNNNGLFLGVNQKSTMFLDTEDNAYIGIKNNTVPVVSNDKKNYYDLFVSGGVLTEDVGLADVDHWADYVFDEKYKLNSLDEVESFIEKEKHLPNIPSQSEIKKDGYQIKEMNVLFLEKIEELTLYTIQQQKELEALKTEVRQLRSQLK